MAIIKRRKKKRYEKPEIVEFGAPFYAGNAISDYRKGGEFLPSALGFMGK